VTGVSGSGEELFDQLPYLISLSVNTQLLNLSHILEENGGGYVIIGI